jgi:transcriptional regulator with XRE-family HTH domain
MAEKSDRGGPHAIRKITRRRVPGVSDPIDVHVGSRVRLRRTLLGLSQERLGEAVGLTFQQIQKYERGANRIGASRMYDLAHVLDVPVSFFFDDMPDDVKQRDAAPVNVAADDEATGAEPNPLNRRETLELVRAYYRISSARVRKRMFELMKAVARVEDAE